MMGWGGHFTHRLVLSLILVLLSAFLPWFFPLPWQGIERLAGDARIRLIELWHHDAQEKRIVLVDIDETSLAKVGAWPWPRNQTADLVTRLVDQDHVAGIALDMVFPEAKAHDDRLARALADPTVHEAVVYGDLDQAASPFALKPSRVAVSVPPGYPRFAMHPVVANHPLLQTGRVGHINPHFDQDGVVRRIPAILCTVEQCHIPLAFSLYWGLIHQREAVIVPGPWWGSAWQLEVAGGRSVPIDAQGFIEVPYRHARSSWSAVSAHDVLQHRVPASLLEGSLVIVGSTALGLSDKMASPAGNLISGMEIHAELLRALLDKDFFVPAQHPWAPYCLILGLFAGVLTWSDIRRKRVGLRGLILGLAFGALLLAGLAVWFGFYGWLHYALPIAPLVIFFGLAPIGFLVLEWIEAERVRADVQTVLNQYIPHEVAERLVETQRDGESIDAQEQVITVLFADILGFTSFTVGRSAQSIAQLTQEIFRTLGHVIEQHGGTIDKYMGDSVLAFWNSPQAQENHAGKALQAATAIVGAIEALAPWARGLGFPNLEIGIGIESGTALVGNFGSSSRRTYTALGEPVVLATRIEAFTRQLPSAILCGPAAYRLLGEDALYPLREVTIKGRDLPLWVYAPRPLQ